MSIYMTGARSIGMFVEARQPRVNTYHRQRTHDPQVQAWIAGVCAGR
jgi:hypothetical protein